MLLALLRRFALLRFYAVLLVYCVTLLPTYFHSSSTDALCSTWPSAHDSSHCSAIIMQATSSVGTPFSLMTPIGTQSIPNRIPSLEHVLTFLAHVPGTTHFTLHVENWHRLRIVLPTGICFHYRTKLEWNWAFTHVLTYA